MNDGCAPAGRRGRAHRHRPYQTPSYFSAQFHTNKITIYTQFAQTASNAHAQSTQTKCVGAVPMCPPERSRGGVSIPKNTRIVCGGENDGCALVGRHVRAAAFPYQEHTHHARGMNDGCALGRATWAGTQAPPLPISTKPRGVPLPHHIVHSIAHANRTVFPYPTLLHIR